MTDRCHLTFTAIKMKVCEYMKQESYTVKITGIANWDEVSLLIKQRIDNNAGVFTEECLKDLPIKWNFESAT